MRYLPLYPTLPQAAIGQVEPAVRDASCTKCPRARGAMTVCMPAEKLAAAQPGHGTLVVVGAVPTRHDDMQGRPMTSVAGAKMRELARKVWKGDIVLDSAVRCAGADPTLEQIAACRPYGAEVLAQADPERIIVLGRQAAEAVLGYSYTPNDAKRGYGWWFNPDTGASVPVFFAFSALEATRNRFVLRDLEAVLRHAATCPLPTPDHTGARTRIVETEADAIDAYDELANAEWFAYDTETSGRMYTREFRIEDLTAWASDGAAGWTFSPDSLNDPARAKWLKCLLENEDARQVGFNLKYDALAVRNDPRLRADAGRIMHADVRLVRKLMDADVMANLDVTATSVGMGGHKQEAHGLISDIKRDLMKLVSHRKNPLTPKGKPRAAPVLSGAIIEEVDAETLAALEAGTEPIVFAYRYLHPVVRARYNARDALATRDAYALQLRTPLRSRGMETIRDEITFPAARALAEMEWNGVAVDRAALKSFETLLELKLQDVRKRLDVYGADFNPDSPDQVGQLLYGRLGLTPRTQDEKPSTDKAALKFLKGKHPVVNDITEWRKFSKLKGTYATGMFPHIRPDGRVHPSYLLDGTSSGRPSGKDPNLLNQPSPDRDPIYGKMLRDCYVAPQDCILIEADMSQQELRVAAFLSGDDVMLADFATHNVDIHRRTAAVVYGVTEAEVTKEQRAKAKVVTFGLVYGKGDKGLSEELGITRAAAAMIREKVLGRFKKLAKWLRETLHTAQREGGVWTWWDGDTQARWRPLPGIGAQGDENFGQRINAENGSQNTPIQGSAADFVTASLWPIHKRFRDEHIPARLILTVYDSIMAEVEDDEDSIRAAHGVMQSVMTSWNSAGVPLVAEFKIGTRWGSMVPYTP